MSTFSEAVADLTATDKDLWLGSLCMYSVEEGLVKHDDLVKILHACNLTAHIPRVPEDSDVFRRVATAAQRKRVPTMDPNVFANLLVREVPSKTGVTKKIVREKVDTSGKKLAYEPDLCDLRYDKSSGKVEVDCSSQDPEIASVAEAITNSFVAQRNCLNGYAIRELIRRILNSVNATNVRGKGGGVYFVSKAHLDKVAALEAFAASMDTVSVMVVPFLDDHKRREYVREAYEQECTAEIKGLLQDVADVREAGKPLSGDKFATFVERYHSFAPQVKEYEELLETQLGSVNSLLKITRDALMGLSTIAQ